MHPIVLKSSLPTNHSHEVLLFHVLSVRHPKVWRSLQRDQCSVSSDTTARLPIGSTVNLKMQPLFWGSHSILLERNHTHMDMV